MPMKKSTQTLDVLLLNLPVALTLCVVAQLLTIAQGQMAAFSWNMFGINFVVSYLLAFVIGMTIPCVKWGLAFAMKCKAKPGSWVFGALIDVMVNTTYAVILCALMTIFNVCILGGAPAIAALFGFLADIIPIWIACYIVSFLCVRPAESLARACTGDRLTAQPPKV